MNVRPEFAVHMLNAHGKEKAVEVARGFSLLLEGFETIIQGAADRNPLTPEQAAQVGRLRSLVKTKLEEACFFAKKAVASLPENQE